jgi:pimeloyl-ACP methyl ester carboxylesterase
VPIQHVEVNGATLGYRTAGTGPPLVMITGFGATMAERDPALIAGLATQHTVVIFDNRGIATSVPSPVRGLTIAKMADDTAGLIDALGLGRADVLGWSMGGNIAQLVVQRHPDKINRLILAGQPARGAAHGSPCDQASRRHQPPDLPAAQGHLPAHARGAGGEQGLCRAPGDVAGPRTRCLHHRHGDRRGPDPGRGAAVVLPRLRGLREAPRIRARTLVTDGRLDIVEPPENSRIIARRIPGAKLPLYRGAGHAHLFQFNGRYAGEVNGFLAVH